MADDFKIKIESEIDLSDAKKQLNEFTKKKQKVEIEADIDTKNLEENINKTSSKRKKVKLDVDSSVLDKLKNKKITVGAEIKGQKSVDNLTNSLKGAKKESDSLTGSFKNIARVGSQIDIFRMIKDQAQDAIKTVKELDDAIVDLQMATNDSYGNIKNLMSDYNAMAKDLSATTLEISSSVDTFLRQGKSISETNKLIKDSTVLSKVAQMQPEDSSKVLTATLNGFQMAADQAEYINDILSSIDLESAADASGLGTALTKVASMAHNAGLSIEKTVASLATMKDVTQAPDESIGNALKSVLSRMNQIKAGKFVDDETGEALNDTEKVLNKVGISMRDVNGQFLEAEVIIDNVGQKWGTFDKNTQKAVATAMAGTYQYNKLISLFDNYNKVLKLTETAQNSAGSSAKKFEENYLNSLEAKQKKLHASFESLAFNTISRDSYAGIIEATQALVEFLDKTNLVKGALTGLAVGGLTKGFLSITTGITKSAMHMQNFQKSLDLLKAGNIGTDGIEKLASYTEGLSQSQTKAVLSSKELTAAQRIQILTAQGMDEATAKATLTTMGLSTAESTATTSTISLGTAFKGLFSTLLSNPLFLIGTAVTAGVSIWQSYKQSIEEAVSSASQAGQQFAENSSSLNDQIAKVKELKSSIASGTLSEEESYNAKSQLLEIQKQLVATYGEQASGIDLVNGSLSEEIDLMNKLSESEANKYLNEEKKGIDKAKKEMEKNRHFYLGEFETNTEPGKELQKIIDKYKELGILSTEQEGLSSIAFDGNVMEAESVINDFLTEVRELAENSGDEFGFLDGIETYASDELREAGKVIEEYEELYNNALNAEMITKGFGEGKPATVIEEYKDAIEEYNEALSNGDTSEIEKAKSAFDNAQSSVDNILKKYPEYQVLFDEVGESLNKTAIQTKEFKDTLANADFKNIVSQFKDLKDVDLKGISFDDETIAKGEESLRAVVDKAIELGIVSDDSAESVAKVVDMLVDMGLTGTFSATALSNSFQKASTSIKETTDNLEALKGILEESVSGSGMSAESVDAFREMFGDDAEKALEKTANGYHLNVKALRELQKQQEEMTKTDYLNGLNEQYTALREIDAQLATAKLFERDTSGLEASRNEIINNISTLEDLQYQYEAATSAYQKWIDAQSNGNERDMYENVMSGYEKVADLIERGWADSDEVRTYIDLLSGEDLSTAPVEDVISAFERLNDTIGNSGHSILDFFTVDEDGNSTTDGIYNFFDTVNSVLGEEYAKLENGKYTFDFSGGRDKEVAEALKMDVEALQTILRAASEAGFEINMDQPLDSMEKLKTKAEEAKTALSDINVNIDADNLSSVDAEIEKTQSYIEKVNESEISPDIKADKLEYANSILEYLLTRKQKLGQTENIDVQLNIDEDELTKGYETLGNLKTLIEKTDGNILLSVDRHNADVEMQGYIAEIEAMSPELKVALGIQGKSIEEIKAGLADGSIQIPVVADPTQAKSDVQSVENEKINNKTFVVTANATQANLALTAVGRLLSGIKSKEVTVTVNRVVNETKGDSGEHKLSGTANIGGTAYAGGNWGNPKTQEVLVGERGTEIVVDPHTANWYTVGDNGSEFRRIPKNAIVFNHIQSKALLKNGRINGRGKALASGTAFSTGSGGVGRPSRPSSSVNDSYSSKKEESTKSSSSDKASEKSEKASKKIIDFVEIAIKRLEEGIKRIKITAESAFKTFTKRNEALGQEMSAIVNKINLSQQAYNKYMSQANSVGLSESYASQVRNGSINIATITDEDLSKKISDYQEW